MLAHRLVNYSTFPAEYRRRTAREACNRWLQCSPMRIELPPASWADTAQRAEDDAHTLTVAAQTTADWVQWQWPADPVLSIRVEVPATEPEALTLTF
jgi:hypothetical protein